MSACRLEHMLVIAWNSRSKLDNHVFMTFLWSKERLFWMKSPIDIISNRIYNVYVHKDISMFFVKLISGRLLRFKLSLPSVCVCHKLIVEKLGSCDGKKTWKKTCQLLPYGDDGNMCDFISQFSNSQRFRMCYQFGNFCFTLWYCWNNLDWTHMLSQRKIFPFWANSVFFFLLLFVSANINVIKWLNLQKFIKQCVKYWSKLMSHV